MSTTEPTHDQTPVAPADPSGHDRYLVAQRFRMMVNQYEVSTLAADRKSAEQPVCFVQQKRMKLKEDLVAFSDDSKQGVLFRIKAKQVWDPAARYDVTDATGRQIGQLQKAFGKSLLRSTWRIYDSAGKEIAWARERNQAVAILRRTIGLISQLIAIVPVIGWAIAFVLDMLPIPYHFEYFVQDRRIGALERIIGLRDRYRLEITDDPAREVDRRVILALSVGMDALQAR